MSMVPARRIFSSPGVRIAAASLLSAILLTLTLPDANVWWLTPVALVPWLLALTSAGRSRTAFVSGWFMGSVASAAIYHWIVHTAVTMSDFPVWAAILVLIAFALWHGIGWGLVGLFARTAIGNARGIWLVPAAVVAKEFAWPQLFPFHLGNAYFRVPLLMQGTDLLGIWGATVVSAAVSVSLAQSLGSGRAHWRRSAWISGVLVAAWIGYGWIRPLTLTMPNDEVALALIQPDITSAEKKQRSAAKRNEVFERLKSLSMQARGQGVDAVIWPEGAFPYRYTLDAAPQGGYLAQAAEASKELNRFSTVLETPMIVGAMTRPGNKSRNSMLLIDRNGQETARYDKRRLLAFGEYMPLSDTFPFLKNRVKEVSDMEGGEQVSALVIPPARILPTLCYEALFPEFVRRALVETDANLIVNLTNDSWFGDSGEPGQHLMVQYPRAVEMRVPLVRVTMTGITAVVSPQGEFLFETDLHERRADVVHVPIGEGRSVYRSVGPVLPWACLMVCVTVAAMTGWQRWRVRRAPDKSA